MSSWTKVVALVVIAVIAFVLIAPDIDLYPTVSRVSHALQKPSKLSKTVFHSAVAAAVMKARSLPALSTQSLSQRTEGDSSTNLIDLKCSRLC